MNPYRNLGHHERVIRVGLGLFLLALSGFSLFPVWGDLVLLIVGLIALLTGIIGFCPAWHLVGINTCQSNPPTSSLSYIQSPVHERANTTSDRP